MGEVVVLLAFVDRLVLEHEALGGRMLRVQEHLGDRAQLDDVAAVHHRHAVADAADHVHLVRDQHDGQLQLAVDLGQQLQHRCRGLWVERAGGLVAEQDAWLGGQCAGDADALLLAAGELRRIVARMVLEADALEQRGDPGINLATRQLAGQAQRHGDVVGHGLGHQQVEVLEDHPDALAEAPQAVGIQRGDVLAIDPDAPARGFLQAVDQAQQGALAGAGVTDQAEYFTGLDAQVGRPQRRYFAAGNPIGFMDLLEFDHGRTLWVRS